MLRLIDDAHKNFDTPPPADRKSLTDPIPALSADEVHVWQADLDGPAAADLMHVLAADELSRANRFHFAKDRDHYVVARGLLRRLIGGYLGVSAAQLIFAYGEKGKPFLSGDKESSLNFNLAHSHGTAIFAFSRNRELGVDLEFMREDFEGDKIAERFFSKPEVATFTTIPMELKRQAFFDCWTRKEAYIKARGDGLSMPLDQFDVAFAPGEAAALLRNHREPAEVGRWRMQSIPAPEGYVAALVASGQDWQLRIFEVT